VHLTPFPFCLLKFDFIDLVAAVGGESANAAIHAEIAKVDVLIAHAANNAPHLSTQAPTPLPQMVQTRISTFAKQLNDFKATQATQGARRYQDDDDDDDEENADSKARKARKKEFLTILFNTCTLVREAETWGSPHVPELVNAMQKIHNDGVAFAYGDARLYGYIPSWAHSTKYGQPLIKDLSSTLLQPRECNLFLRCVRLAKAASTARGILDMLGMFGMKGDSGMDMCKLGDLVFPA
jgi:hypothetical protein